MYFVILAGEVNGVAVEYLRFVTEGLDRDEALHDLMTAYGKDVWHYAFFLTLNADLADDLMQETFLRAYQHMASFRGQASVKTWLLTITRNAVTDHRRSAWIRKVTLFGLVSPRQLSPSAEDVVMCQMEQMDVWKQVLRLSIPLREVLLLHAHHGLPLAAIAELLGITEGTVKSRLHRARAKVGKLRKEDEAQ